MCVAVFSLQGMKDALKGALTSVLQQSPHRRVALVTFSDDVGELHIIFITYKVNYILYVLINTSCPVQVVIYGDGTSVPLTLNDWALVDYDHIWQQSVAYSVPHCIAETYNQLMQRVQE